jgi:hypothetical protein
LCIDPPTPTPASGRYFLADEKTWFWRKNRHIIPEITQQRLGNHTISRFHKCAQMNSNEECMISLVQRWSCNLQSATWLHWNLRT